MAHDGQDPTLSGDVRLADLLATGRAAIPPAEALLDAAKAHLRDVVVSDGRVSGAAVEAHQDAVHGLAWLATYVEALRQMQSWAEKLDAEGALSEVEALIHQIAFGEYVAQIAGGISMNQGETVRLHDLGLTDAECAAF